MGWIGKLLRGVFKGLRSDFCVRHRIAEKIMNQKFGQLQNLEEKRREVIV